VGAHDESDGVWVDLKNPYITYETDYIETCGGLFADREEKIAL